MPPEAAAVAAAAASWPSLRPTGPEDSQASSSPSGHRPKHPLTCSPTQTPNTTTTTTTTTSNNNITNNNAPTDRHSNHDRPRPARRAAAYPCSARASACLVALVGALLLAVRRADSTVTVMRPSSKSATLVPGQPLHFECARTYNKEAQFLWYKRNVVLDETREQPAEVLLDPNLDDTIEIHNERLTLLKPNYAAIGDYICRALNEDRSVNPDEFATIKVRTQPYVADFGIETSHTGKSATIEDGARLELMCRVRDESVPVNITWLMSEQPDSEELMLPVYPELEPSVVAAQERRASLLSPSARRAAAAAADSNAQQGELAGGVVPSYAAPANMYVEVVDAFAKRLVIREAGPQHRGHYACLVHNGVTERTRKFLYVRVKDKIVALWPFLGILAELFILFTIIYVWETQRAQKALAGPASGAASKGAPPGRSLVPGASSSSSSSGAAAAGAKRAPSGPSAAFESVPLNA